MYAIRSYYGIPTWHKHAHVYHLRIINQQHRVAVWQNLQVVDVSVVAIAGLVGVYLSYNFV